MSSCRRCFEQSHGEIGRWFSEGLVDGLRIDHPDGLADPAGYLADLATLTGGAYVLVEKILEPGEKLPVGWKCQGTTGYDALALAGPGIRRSRRAAVPRRVGHPVCVVDCRSTGR